MGLWGGGGREGLEEVRNNADINSFQISTVLPFTSRICRTPKYFVHRFQNNFHHLVLTIKKLINFGSPLDTKSNIKNTSTVNEPVEFHYTYTFKLNTNTRKS
jgi:hypothetical protein